MKVIFKTNIDAYQSTFFPSNLETPPRKGEKVMVIQGMVDYLSQKKLPLRLEVVEVTWSERGVVCELWYNETDKKIADLAGAKTL